MEVDKIARKVARLLIGQSDMASLFQDIIAFLLSSLTKSVASDGETQLQRKILSLIL